MAAASSSLSTPTSFLLQKNRNTRHVTTPSLLPLPLRRVVACSASSSTDRLFNFAAGPATLPEPVLKKAQSEMYTWRDSGMSVMEMSHRGKDFLSIIQKAEGDLRKLLNVPEEYSVLFLQGGATSQFAAIPMNLCGGKEDDVDFIVTGSWGDKAFKEAGKYCKPNLVWSGKSEKYTKIPSFEDKEDDVDFIVTGSWGDKAFKEVGKYCKPNLVWSGKSEKYTKIPSFQGLSQTPKAKYLHICANETIHGVEFKNYPNVFGDGVLVADMSSNFCSKPVDVSKFGIIYAGAQKNVGPSGVTIVIIRKDLIGKAQDITPVMLEYKIHDENNSLYNTPPCYNIYMCGLVFEDLLAQGGLGEVEKKNEKKAKILYDAIDGSGGFYKCPVEKSVRSLMNVPFTMEKSELEGDFIKEAAKEKMVQLKGHRSVGGMRASIYNAMPLAGVEKLVAFMKDFQAKHA